MANPKLATLTDAFPGTALNSANWYIEPIAGQGNTPSGTATVANGILTLSQNTGYTSVNSQNSYDITSSYAFCKLIPDPSSTADQADSGFGIWNTVTAPDGSPGFSNGYEIGVQQGKLYVMAVVNDTPAAFSFSAAYDATSMAFARIRESGGNLIFGYSADAQAWTEPGWTLTPSSQVLDVTNCSVQIYAGNLGSTSAGSAGFAAFNVTPAPAPPSGSYTLFGQAVPASVTSGAGNAGTNGVQFSVTQSCALDGIWTYSAPALTELPVTIGLYDTASQALVHSETASWSAGPGTGWVYAAFSSPPSLTAGTTYTAVQFRDDAVNGWFCYSPGSWANAITSGPLTAPAAASQGWYDNTGTVLHFPATQAAGNNWHLDVQVTPSVAPLVQEASASTAGTTLTITFPAAVTAGNTVILAVAGYYSGTVTGIELGGTAGTWDHVASAGGTGGNNLNFYACYGAGVSSASLVVTTDAPGIIGWAYEAAGAVTVLDRAAGAVGAGTSWSSGATAQTIPYPHLVIGAAAVLDSAASVTPAAAGWANGDSYSGVGSTRPCGGVAGYMQPSSSGTYTYSGTASASAAWGAVTAAFLTVPAPAGTQPGWGGVVFGEHSSYTGITADFTIPSSLPAESGDLVSIWAGIGNVYQCGIYMAYDSAKPGGVSTSPWSWWLAGAGELWDATAYPTGAGDSLSLSIEVTGANWLMTIANATQGWSYTEVKSTLCLNLGTWATTSGGAQSSPGWIYPVGSAEVIIEKEGAGTTTDYGSITFTNVTTTPPATVAPSSLFTVNTAVDQYPGAFDVANGSFTMHWNAFS